MIYGGDYYDLAKFYWNEGNHSEALAVAEEGINKGQGRMDELQQFLSDRAQEGGNREKYLELKYEMATNPLTMGKYKAFKNICTEEEWKLYEKKLLQNASRIRSSELLDIFMDRKEYDQALETLLKTNYSDWDSDRVLQAARQLETRFPDKVLAYHLSGFNGISRESTRKGYAARARMLLNIRRILLDVLKDDARWKQFAGRFKKENRNRPALQEEFGSVISDWPDL